MKKWLNNIWSYLVGNYRQWVYESPFNSLMRNHISEQIEWRISVMNTECYNNGSCLECGCMIPGLQMAHKSCGGDCYPPLMNQFEWEFFLKGASIDSWTYVIKGDKHKIFKGMIVKNTFTWKDGKKEI